MRILARGSVNLGATADTERLLLMLTRSCQLRCAYCLVATTETGRVMSESIARRSVDLLMNSARTKLDLQFFGGEPTQEWDLLVSTMRYAATHPHRRGRPLELVVTTNGLTLTAERLSTVADLPLTWFLSLDGDAFHSRFRRARKLADDGGTELLEAAIAALNTSGARWFANCVVAPAAADELPARYAWARSMGIPQFQIGYAVGVPWREAQIDTYHRGLAEVLRDHHANPGEMVLFNWRSECEPVVLSDDLIVDVDGTVLHDGAIFLEKGFGKLHDTYRIGHLDQLSAFDPLRWSLLELYEVMMATYPGDSREHGLLRQGILFGARSHVLIEHVAAELGRR
jgi:pyruvate-formate lyase-activating enzyme